MLRWLLTLGTACVACSGVPTHDASVSRDGAIDVRDAAASDARDAGRDAPWFFPPDAFVEPVDAGPWPPFEPRIVWEDPTVHCEPLTYPFAATPPPADAAFGDVLWSLDLARDLPDVWARVASRDLLDWGTELIPSYMTVMLDGGVVATKAPGNTLAVDGTGHWIGNSFTGVYHIPPYGPDDLRITLWTLTLTPNNHIWAPPELFPRVDELRFDPTGNGEFDPVGQLRMPGQLGDLGPARIQSLGVLVDGTVVSAMGEQFVLGSCADGRNRWLVETPTRPHDVFDAPHFTALRDGTFLAHTQRMIWHFDADGHALASMDFQGDYVEGCGIYRSTANDRGTLFERVELDTAINLGSLQLGPNETNTVASDCSVWVETDADATGRCALRRVDPDGHVRWTRRYDFDTMSTLTALDDDGLLIGPGTNGAAPTAMIAVDADGDIRFEHSYEGDPILSAYTSSTVVRPDGVAVVGIERVSAGPVFAAVYTGVTPGRTAWYRGRTTWARNGAVWMLPPP